MRTATTHPPIGAPGLLRRTLTGVLVLGVVTRSWTRCTFALALAALVMVGWYHISLPDAPTRGPAVLVTSDGTRTLDLHPALQVEPTSDGFTIRNTDTTPRTATVWTDQRGWRTPGRPLTRTGTIHVNPASELTVTVDRSIPNLLLSALIFAGSAATTLAAHLAGTILVNRHPHTA